jgi:hypothetical protein
MIRFFAGPHALCHGVSTLSLSTAVAFSKNWANPFRPESKSLDAVVLA